MPSSDLPLPTIGIITALPEEYVAAEAVVDGGREYVAPGTGVGRRFCIGTIPAFGGGTHSIALCQVGMGNNSAAIRATMLKTTFPTVQYMLMVGIAGGAPDPKRPEDHVRLGDIVVSGLGGVVQYDNVKETERGTEYRHSPRAPSPVMLEADEALRRAEVKGELLWMPHLRQIQSKVPGYERPSTTTDVVLSKGILGYFRRRVRHPRDSRRNGDIPRVFRGVIASANSLQKNPAKRDLLRDRFRVRAIEMEASGIADATWHLEAGYFVVRGICDYCDRNKNDDWHHYAAAVSAAYCRALVEQMPSAGGREIVSVGADLVATVEPTSESSQDHRRAAEALLRAAQPRSIASLFESPSAETLEAIAEFERTGRTAREVVDREPRRLALAELLRSATSPQLIVAPPGAGKTFAVWRAAQAQLAAGVSIPIFLPVGDMESSRQVERYVVEKLPDGLAALKRNPNVMFVVDGWTEFPRGADEATALAERRNLLTLLGNGGVVATGRSTDMGDPSFHRWQLEPLEEHRVVEILARVSVQGTAVPSRLLDFLRHPLPLLLHLLMRGSSAASEGTLLAAFQRHVSRAVAQPDAVLKALSEIALNLTLRGDGLSRSAFDREVAGASQRAGVPDLMSRIVALGAFTVYADRVVPFHDLYWEWLAGVGAVRARGDLIRIVRDLRLRRGLTSALEGGERVSAEFGYVALSIDLRLAAEVAEFIDPLDENAPDVRERIAASIETALKSDQHVVQHRAIEAAALDPKRVAFDTLVAAIVAVEPDAQFLRVNLSGSQLWEVRNELTLHLSTPAVRSDIVNAIVASGDARWVDWLEASAQSGSLPIGEACGAALACTATIPIWVERALPSVLRTGGWHLRPASARGLNKPLARWVADHYPEFVNREHMTWYDMNAVLVRCGDDEIYGDLLSRFLGWDERAQSVLGFAIQELGPEWLGRFQTAAFSDGNVRSNHHLYGLVSGRVSEATARAWIAASDRHLRALGWRTLARFRQNDIVSEIVAALPPSFDGIDECYPLEAISELAEPPSSLLDELWKRVRGTLMPMTAEQLVYAIASIRPGGVPSMIGRIQSGLVLPTYHLDRFLITLRRWEQRHQRLIMAQTPTGLMSYGESVVFNTFAANPADPFVDRMFRTYRPVALAISILDRAAAGDVTANDFVRRMGSVGRYHAGYVDYLLRAKDAVGVRAVVDLFSSALAEFPEQRLLEMLSIANALEDPSSSLEPLLNAVAASASLVHIRFHRMLLASVIQRLTGPRLDVLSVGGRLLAMHAPETIRSIVRELPPMPDSRTLALVRFAEQHRNQILASEGGVLL